ncbi:MAG: Ig-like domain-containing protein [Muribaculaceae bacterium]|nr:Ig-like domain-containing protein [Muribaculaceae bacterium]
MTPQRHSIIVISILAVLAAIAAGCASIGNPSGGPRDEQPPRFIRANPAPGSANVSQRIDKIDLRFDEIVNVKDAMTKVAVSPPSSQIPKVASQGRHVTVTFPDTLLPNTTYTIDFGNAIEDNNESNPLENFSYTFSTGAIVDSLRISGMAASAFDLEPMQYKLVGIHRIPDDVADAAYRLLQTDSLIFSRRFDRVAKTDERGRFSIEGIAPGRYRIYALDDTNNDFIYSSPSEALAFSEEIIIPSSSATITSDSIFDLKTGVLDTVMERRRTLFLPNNILLRSCISARQQQYIKKYERIDSTRLLLVMGAPMRDLPRLSLLDDSIPFYNYGVTEKRAQNDSLTVWLTDRRIISTDTLRLAVTYPKLDSLNRYIPVTDTLRFTTDRAKARTAKKQDKKSNKGKAKDLLKSNKKEEQADSENDSEIKNHANDENPVDSPALPSLTINFDNKTQEVNLPFSFEISQPPLAIDTTLFRLEQKVDTLWLPALKDQERLRLRQDSLNPRKFHIDFPWKAGGEYKLMLDSLAVTGIYGNVSAPQEQQIRVRPENEYATLKMNLTDWPASLPAFGELLSQSEDVVATAPLRGGSLYFPYLTAGKYYLRIIHDRDADGLKTPSDILAGVQADESYYYPKAINIKKNWNKEESWSVFSTPVDKMKPESILRNKPAVRGGRQTPRKQTPTEEDEDEDW